MTNPNSVPIADVSATNQSKRKHILRKLHKVQKISQKLHAKAWLKLQTDLSRVTEVAHKEKLNAKFQRDIDQINRIKCEDEIPLFEALFVEDIILGVQRVQQQLDDFLDMYVKKADDIPDQQLRQFCSEMLWYFWDDALTQIENENEQILTTVKLSNCTQLMEKFANDLAKFRVMGKLYSEQIAKELETNNLKSCVMSMVIALEGMAEQMALKHNLCSGLACTEAPAVNKKKLRRGAETNSVGQQRGRDILVAMYLDLLYKKSPVLYEAIMTDARNDVNRFKSISRGRKCLDTMPSTVYNNLMHKTKSIMRKNPSCSDADTFIQHWSAS